MSGVPVGAELERVAGEERVGLLYAAEAGSRCFGTHGPDSDFDARFVFRRPIEDYLGVSEAEDTIVRTTGAGDVVGYDVRRALRLTVAGSPKMRELAWSLHVHRRGERVRGRLAEPGGCIVPSRRGRGRPPEVPRQRDPAELVVARAGPSEAPHAGASARDEHRACAQGGHAASDRFRCAGRVLRGPGDRLVGAGVVGQEAGGIRGSPSRASGGGEGLRGIGRGAGTPVSGRGVAGATGRCIARAGLGLGGGRHPFGLALTSG